MYQLSDPYNDRDRWVNYDNNAELYWSDYAANVNYWMLASSHGYALPDDEAERFGFNPPIGDYVWSVHASNEASPPGGTSTLTLECSTCKPTPAPTSSPSNVITPSPTTPAPSVMPTVSPSTMPSTVPTP